MDFFPLFNIEKRGNIVLSYKTKYRKLSPNGGGSTLITSAPWSAKKVPAHGPLMNFSR